MSRLFEVEVRVTFVIAAEDDEHAIYTADYCARAAVQDDSLDDVMVVGEITNIKQLPAGWDGACHPYASPSMGEQDRIGVILAGRIEAPTPDTQTIDMFTQPTATEQNRSDDK